MPDSLNKSQGCSTFKKKKKERNRGRERDRKKKRKRKIIGS